MDGFSNLSGGDFFEVPGFDQELERFAWWLLEIPGRAEQVQEDISTLQRVREMVVATGLVSYADLLAARDAAARMCNVAYGGDFALVLSVFVRYHEAFCRALLSCWREVS